ncbi:WhiB family transcriptional regulator [Streptomyces sp. NPDC004682]
MKHITTYDAPTTSLRGIGDISWQARGACHGMDPEDADETFFSRPRDHDAIADAKELCGVCPVRRDCLNYALENDLTEGVWGGLTAAERKPWHKGLPHRLDYSRVAAFFNGRDVHLTDAERQVVIDHAYVRGWRPDRLATALRVSPKHARDLLRQAANKVFDRDRNYDVPRMKRKRTKTTHTKPNTQQPVSRPVRSASADAPLGKAA